MRESIEAVGTYAERMLWTDACLRDPRLWAPEAPRPSWLPTVIPPAPGKFYKRYPKGKLRPLVPLSYGDPALWLPLSCAWSLIASTKGAGNGATDAVTGNIDTSGATLIVISAACYAFPAAPIVLSDNQSNVYALLTEQVDGSDANLTARMGYKVSPTTNAAHNFTNSGAFPSLCVEVFSGTPAASPFDQQSGSNANSVSSKQPGSLTPPENDVLFVCGGGNGSSLVVTSIDSSFTLQQAQTGASGVNMGTSIAHKIQSGAGAENPTNTLSGTGWMAAMMATFKIDDPGGSTWPGYISPFGWR